MIDKLDGADVLMISDFGHYHYIKTVSSDDAGVEVCYYAICKYENDDGIYLFSCDVNMSVVGDSLFDSEDDAVQCAERWAETSITWIKQS